MPHRLARVVAAVAAAALAFGLYVSTTLPGQDLGDTASFQASAGDRELTPRDGYPLYFAVTGAFVHALPLERAHAANLASAALAALAVGVLALVGARLAGSTAGGLFGALLFAASYTFWSQAIIAEVYALHLLVVSVALLALLWWADRPSPGRLALVFLAVALGFGNHLSMVLLLPAFAVFLLVSAPGGALSLLRPRVLLTAAGIALACSLQYAWNLSTVDPVAFGDPGELARDFWFDVTKSDWRASMVAGIPAQRMGDRLAMYWFDLRQQFGVPGIAAAAVGAVALLVAHWRRGLLLVLLWAVAWGFAITYNVGDVHVFFLPSHLVVALWAGCGAAAVLALPRRARDRTAMTSRAADRRGLQSVTRPQVATALVAVAFLAYPAWRAWDTWPALDRHADTTPREFFDRLVSGLTPFGDVFAAELGWQQHNGIGYYGRHTRPDLSIGPASPILLHFPFFVWRNQELGRDVVLSEAAAALVRDTYGPLFAIEPDPRLPTPTLVERLRAVPPGAPYALTMLRAYREGGIEPDEVRAAVAVLAGRAMALPEGQYWAIVGRAGEDPRLIEAADRPFRRTVDLGGMRLEVRMEAWLSTDTIRRAGFGHVVESRRHLLTVDRGLSCVALGPEGNVILRTWQGGMLTPQGRFVIR
ncbi:MAG TPA: DUF2723 domain-containing protein [Vicinamibacterales bacterium]|nr:DUF2723 domain-containing protein [Vicinamibacterales bacterium]